MARAIALVLVLATAAAARAQPARTELREVERGFSVASELGAVFFPELPGGDASASGALLGVSIGGELGPVRLGVVGWGQSLGAGADFRGIGGSADPHRARGDFQVMMAGLDLRLSIPIVADAQGVDRTFLALRAVGGPTVTSPAGVLDASGAMAGAGAGILFHTRVRHFAVGLDALALGHFQDAGTSLGLAVLPSLRYTF
jgi:hypothetical protein